LRNRTQSTSSTHGARRAVPRRAAPRRAMRTHTSHAPQRVAAVPSELAHCTDGPSALCVLLASSTAHLTQLKQLTQLIRNQGRSHREPQRPRGASSERRQPVAAQPVAALHWRPMIGHVQPHLGCELLSPLCARMRSAPAVPPAWHLQVSMRHAEDLLDIVARRRAQLERVVRETTPVIGSPVPYTPTAL
jgi:hypothetical protein